MQIFTITFSKKIKSKQMVKQSNTKMGYFTVMRMN